MPFNVAESDPREISFFHRDRAFRRHDPLTTATESVHPGLEPRFLRLTETGIYGQGYERSDIAIRRQASCSDLSKNTLACGFPQENA